MPIRESQWHWIRVSTITTASFNSNVVEFNATITATVAWCATCIVREQIN
jgi:hypothetical protein